MKLRVLVVIATSAAMMIGGQARAAEQRESLGERIKRLFTGPTPTPKPSPTPKKRKPRPRPSSSPTSSPSPSGASGEPLPEPSSAALPESTSTTSPEEASPRPAESRTPPLSRTQTSEPVRPISPPPGKSLRTQSTPTAEEKKTPKPLVSTSAQKAHAALTTISPSEIAGYENYPAAVRKILDFGLGLTSQNLTYKYNSADPAKGGMDCSGFIYYVLSQSGIKDVPRDAREQYTWVRKAGTFQAVLAQRDDTFELDALKPGDLLFWAATYTVSGEPDITQTMIYLGREEGTNQRIMVGASDGRTYKGQLRSGVSVFDFKIGRLRPKKNDEPGTVFVGYSPIPGLNGE